MATSYGNPPAITNRSGQTISAKWLADQNGNYIIDPLTSKPYLVSADFDFQKFVTFFQNAKAYADTFPSSVERSGFIAGILLRFAPGAEFDIQRSYGGVVPGYFEGGSRFVSAFTDAANFVYGVACNTVGLTQNECLAGGGAAKLVSATLSSQPVGSLSDWFNPPNNATNIRTGYSFTPAPAPAPVIVPTITGTRVNSDYFTINDAHSVVLKSGGTLYDLWMTQGKTNGFTSATEFYSAVMVCNPAIIDPNVVSVGQKVYVPQKLANGSITYNYSDGGYLNNNAATGEYNFVVPDGMGGSEIYTKIRNSDGNYAIQQRNVSAKGEEVYNYQGVQDALTGTVKPVTINSRNDTNSDGVTDQIVVDSYDNTGKETLDTRNLNSNGTLKDETKVITTGDKKNSESEIDSNGDGKWDQFNVSVDSNNDGTRDQFIYSGTSQSSLFNADRQLDSLHDLGWVTGDFWIDYTSWSTSQLVNNSLTLTTPVTYGLFDPIGAFYESRTLATDPATSIANKTFRILNSAGVGLTAAQLAALDVNLDGKLSGTELTGLTAWQDLNEDGINQTATELVALSTALTNAGLSAVRSNDYAFYASGNASYRTVAQNTALAPVNSLVAPTAPAALASNYATLRTTDNRFYVNAYVWIDWAANQIKISSNQLNLVGTDGNDNFDVNYYSAYNGVYFNLSLIQNFYAGAGNDIMGGSSRNDNLWGGTGNDVLLGYEGDDKLFGEDGDDELQGGIGNDALNGGAGIDRLFGQDGNDNLSGELGNDELQGGAGNDVLDGGVGDDKLFGQVGNDSMNGGDGADIMVGFTASNDVKQTLAAGETDDDTMFGGAGADQMYGGFGNDYIDGGADNDLVVGDDGADRLYGSAGDDELNGGAGNDTMDGGIGIDKLFGGAGNDQMWGGDGNDVMMGFTASNDLKQTLAAGETDDDLMYGGAGDDLMLGGFGTDQMWGGIGNDELQGGDGNDLLYGEAGNDRLFGQVGNDIIYGGDGDDFIMGFTGTNEAKQTMAAGESDNDFLYGGAGADTIVGGLGNDYIDGGAGADYMEGGQGNDTYIVNSVNDVILEQASEGYDTVISSSNYILNANIEELRLVEGFNVNGTGNSLNNRIIGNGLDNILDGVTGADVMIGGLGNDTYYVDNLGDQVVELAGEGTDTINASISYTLGANVENLTLLDFSKAEKGIADGVNILVYGYPKANELDYMQGNAVAGYKGTCALTSIANLATQANQALSEAQVVQTAINNNWCVTDPTKTDYQRGGSNYLQQQALLSSYGIRNGIIMGYNEQAIANLIKGGRGVIIGLNAGKLWADSAYLDAGGVNHVVTVTGVACDAATGAINGFYIADSGRGKVSDMTRYVSAADFRADANVANAYTIYTIDPIKLWEENINATGNDLANGITGNRGNNILTGGKGNDTLVGQAGNDTYVFNRGDGQDTIIESDTTVGNTDVLQLNGINQTNLWLKHVGNDLNISIMGGTDLITLKDWYSGSANQVERIKTADGLTMYNTDVEKLVQAMSIFAQPTAAQTSWSNGQTSNGAVLLTVTH